MRFFDNVTNIVRDDMTGTIIRGSRVSIAAACFSMYAYNELKTQLEGVDELRFIFTSPTFVTEKESKQKREFYIPKHNREQSLYGTDDIGCERGNNAYNIVNRFENPVTKEYLKTFEAIWSDKDKLQDVTDVVIENIATAYNENAPELIYFITLFNVFYENLNVTPTIKKCFVEQIKVIYWRNKIASSTTNLATGSTVTEIEVFEIKLKTNLLDEGVLRQIDKEIPYHILFLLEYDGKYQAWTAYKEAASGNTAFKVNQYYHTDWMTEDELPLKLDGLNVDAVYENFVYQIAGDTLQANENESLQDAVERDKKIQSLKKQIEVLQAKIRKEKQLNVQMELNKELNKELKLLKKALEEMSVESGELRVESVKPYIGLNFSMKLGLSIILSLKAFTKIAKN